MSHSTWPWLLGGGAAVALVYFRMRRSERRAASEGAAPHDPDLRNASLSYRPIGRSGEPYPDWVRALRGKSGVYVIRERQRDGSNPVVYVGESHTARLYQTLTRHFQTWRRAKKFWSGQYTGGQNHDPGLTYDRARVTVAVRVLPAERAMDEEARLIVRLRPGQPVDQGDDDVPF